MSLVTALTSVPVDLDRDAARELARQELSGSEYREQQPGLASRALEWIGDKIERLLSQVGGAGPGGWIGWLLVVLVIGVVVTVVLYRTGGLRGSAATGQALFLGAQRSAATWREKAEGHAADGRWAEAVRDRLRALAAGLEERGVLDPRAGRTADELAVEAGAAIPTAADELRQAASVFDEIWYGGRAATPEAYALVREVDDRLGRRREHRIGNSS